MNCAQNWLVVHHLLAKKKKKKKKKKWGGGGAFAFFMKLNASRFPRDGGAGDSGTAADDIPEAGGFPVEGGPTAFGAVLLPPDTLSGLAIKKLK